MGWNTIFSNYGFWIAFVNNRVFLSVQDDISDFSDDDEPMKSAAELLSQQFGVECGYGMEEEYYWYDSVVIMNIVIRP